MQSRFSYEDRETASMLLLSKAGLTHLSGKGRSPRAGFQKSRGWNAQFKMVPLVGTIHMSWQFESVYNDIVLVEKLAKGTV